MGCTTHVINKTTVIAITRFDVHVLAIRSYFSVFAATGFEAVDLRSLEAEGIHWGLLFLKQRFGGGEPNQQCIDRKSTALNRFV